MEKQIKKMIDSDQHSINGFRDNPLHIGPSTMVIKAAEKPNPHALWHMKHKPYQIGGDGDAGRTENRE